MTRCDAAQSWNEAARFRRVCPALRRSAEGWVCSVEIKDVRPYWGRAVLCYAAMATLLYVAGVTGLFLVLRREGSGLALADVLWPTRWENIGREQSAYYVRQASAAMARHDLAAVWLNLASATETAPHDYAVRLGLAQLDAKLSFLASAEREFQTLTINFPEKRALTAVAWHDSLVVTRQFQSLGRLAITQLADPQAGEKAAWMRALFVALRGARSAQEMVDGARGPMERLSPLLRSALQAEVRFRAGNANAIDEWPVVPLTAENLALLTVYGESVGDSGRGGWAGDEIARLTPAIGRFEAERLTYRLHSRAGSRAAALAAFDRMLRFAGRPQERERLLAVLIEFPHAECVGRLANVAENPQTRFSVSELAGTWVAAVLAENTRARDVLWRRLSCEPEATSWPTIPGEATPLNAAIWSRLLPLERDVMTELSLRFRAGKPGRREHR